MADIRRTAARVSAGELQQRVPASASEHADEFAHLNRDINNMLDRIQALMDGVRNVSDSIAHNVRTPLARVLTRLRMAQAGEAAALAQANQYAVAQIEELIVMVEKLLQIAEAESGMRRQGFSAVRLDCICADVAELYGPMAEEGGCRLEMAVGEPVRMHGDADLLAGMIANLVENAIKYAGRPARVRIEAEQQGETVSLTVRDDGQGIPRPHLARLGTRFHRVDRSTPGYGLGLASVRATAGLHGGSVRFRDAAPGLAVDIVFPAPTA